VLDYREAHQLKERIEITWHDLVKDPLRGEKTRAVWWMKTKQVNYDPLKDTVTYADNTVTFKAQQGL
jgi:hypothetical protein